MKHLFLGMMGALLMSGTFGYAGDVYLDEEDMVPTQTEKDWSIELGSGFLFSNIRTDDPHNNATLVPIDLTAELAIDDVSLDNFAGGIFRGYTSFIFRGNFTEVVFGAQNYLGGISVGPRYNFVQPGWAIVPFIGAEVGLAFAYSDPEFFADGGQSGLGQDFNFMFGVEAGARYDITENFFVRLAAVYRHYSNAGMSEPQIQNKPIDALGPELSFGVRF